MKFIKTFLNYLIDPRVKFKGFKNRPASPDLAKNELGNAQSLAWYQIINPPLVLGGIVLLGLILILLFGPQWATYDPYITARSVLPHFDMEKSEMIAPPFAPSDIYPLGSDNFGNDLLSLIFFGARVTLVAGAYITLTRVIIGLILGGLAGWFEGTWLDKVITGASVVISSIPLLLSSMIMIYALDIQKGLWVFVVALSTLGWTEISQLIRGEFIRIRKTLYVEAAEALGLTKIQIIIRHAIPNVFSYLISLSFLEMGAVLLLVAELGFLSVFIGGGSRFSSDPFAPGFIQMVEVPEWGAMVALGTPFFRSATYMVFAPALAFFVSIVGLNSFGEGLRRLFDRWPFSTAIFLRKRIILIIAIFVACTAFIFQRTSPLTSYQRVSSEFNPQRAAEHIQAITSFDTQTFATAAENPLVLYLKDNLSEFGMKRAWRSTLHSYYHYPITTAIVRPLAEPHLVVGDQKNYHHLEDFGFITLGCGGGGKVDAPLAFVGGTSLERNPALDDLNLQGQVILSPGADVPANFPDQVAALGALGVLLISDDAQPIVSQFEMTGDMTKYQCPNEIPVFKITPSAAESILAQTGHTLAELSSPAEESFIQPLDIDASMSLELSQPTAVEIPNAVGFLGGYDMDYANELVVVFTTFDGLGLTPAGQDGIPASDAVSMAVFLESARIWQENNLDPRRSIIFVMWGGEYLEHSLDALLYDLWVVNRLNPEVPAAPVKPSLWVQVGPFGTENTSFQSLTPANGADPSLYNVFIDSANKAGLDITPSANSGKFIDTRLPSIYFWDENADLPENELNLDELQNIGETTCFTLIRLLREIKYTPMDSAVKEALSNALRMHTHK